LRRLSYGLALACFLGLSQPAALAAPMGAMTVQTLVDRAEIEDLLTRYYYNFGSENVGSFSTFYADDAELALGPNSYKGKEGIERAYRGAGQNSPFRNVFAANITISNPLISVHGNSATAQLIFTETVIDKQGTAPRLLQQGREYDILVKANGHWRFKKRQIVAGTQPPAGWPG
jgi:hypothetical protein